MPPRWARAHQADGNASLAHYTRLEVWDRTWKIDWDVK